ncbi:MAG: hypothetical protein E2O39_14295 [Planctomycetota bacterium]|nr:MAG: hypothetical protein E2O39_14295 [Planctomycetota bacterium]
MRNLDPIAPTLTLIVACLAAAPARAAQCSSAPASRGAVPAPAAGAPAAGVPAPTRPAPGPSSPAARAGVPASAAATPITLAVGASPDFSSWSVWWEHNRDQYLDLRGKLALAHSRTAHDEGVLAGFAERRPGLTRELVYGEIVPELLHVLRQGKDDYLVRTALIALARIGDGEVGAETLTPIFTSFLKGEPRAVAETAVIALGALGSPAAARVLAELARDGDAGRKACGERRVPVRTRALAAYGLGLTGSLRERPELARFAVHHLAAVLSADARAYPDLQAACVIALGTIELEDRGEADAASEGASVPPSATRAGQVAHLLAIFRDQSSPLMARIHAPAAMARLAAGAAPELKEEVAKAMIQAADPRKGEKTVVRRSCIAALGLLGDSDLDGVDAAIRSTLIGTVKHGDQIGRAFAMVALAQVAARPGETEEDRFAGADEVARFFAKQLARGKSRVKPWVGLAIGVLGHGLADEHQRLSRSTADALMSKLGDTRAARDASAFALGLGLLHDGRAREYVEDRFDAVNDDYFRGQLAIALGFMGDTGSLAKLTEAMDEAEHRPLLMEQAALGRALIGDATLVPDLLERMQACDCWGSTAGVTRALAWTGDHRAVRPLLGMLRDERRSDRERSLVIEALGRIADKESVPFDARISAGLNYTEAPPTLTHPGGYGILDSLSL